MTTIFMYYGIYMELQVCSKNTMVLCLKHGITIEPCLKKYTVTFESENFACLKKLTYFFSRSHGILSGFIYNTTNSLLGSLPNGDGVGKHLNVWKYILDTSTTCYIYRFCTFQTSRNFLKQLKRTKQSYTCPLPEQKLEIFMYIISTLH